MLLDIKVLHIWPTPLLETILVDKLSILVQTNPHIGPDFFK